VSRSRSTCGCDDGARSVRSGAATISCCCSRHAGDARSCSLVLADAPAHFTSPRCFPEFPIGRRRPWLIASLRRQQLLGPAPRIILKLILLYLSTIRAHPSAGNELTINPLVKPLHLRAALGMVAMLMFDVHA